MAEMEMGVEAPPESRTNLVTENSPKQATAEYSSDRIAFDLPIESCPHCWIHSQPTSGTATIVAADPSKRLVETNAPPANFAVALPFAFPVPIIPSEHGPPGNLFPRHLLINVFRI